MKNLRLFWGWRRKHSINCLNGSKTWPKRKLISFRNVILTRVAFSNPIYIFSQISILMSFMPEQPAFLGTSCLVCTSSNFRLFCSDLSFCRMVFDLLPLDVWFFPPHLPMPPDLSKSLDCSEDKLHIIFFNLIICLSLWLLRASHVYFAILDSEDIIQNLLFAFHHFWIFHVLLKQYEIQRVEIFSEVFRSYMIILWLGCALHYPGLIELLQLNSFCSSGAVASYSVEVKCHSNETFFWEEKKKK